MTISTIYLPSYIPEEMYPEVVQSTKSEVGLFNLRVSQGTALAKYTKVPLHIQYLQSLGGISHLWRWKELPYVLLQKKMHPDREVCETNNST